MFFLNTEYVKPLKFLTFYRISLTPPHPSSRQNLIKDFLLCVSALSKVVTENKKSLRTILHRWDVIM